MDRPKLRWLWKLFRSKNFIVITDEGSVISIKGVSPESFDDLLLVASQSASLQGFRYNLDELIERHDDIMSDFTGGKKIKVKSE